MFESKAVEVALRAVIALESIAANMNRIRQIVEETHAHDREQWEKLTGRS